MLITIAEKPVHNIRKNRL